MSQVDDRALILQGFPYSDTSRILRLFCENHGVRTVIAKGALRPRSRFGGLLEPFTEGRAQFRLRDGRDMHTLAGFDLLCSRQAIGRNLMAFAGASLLSELVLRFGTTEPDPALFDLLCHQLDRLSAVDETAAAGAALGAVWQAVARLGYEPRLDGCVRCDREIGRHEATRFDVESGGVVCVGCRPEGRIVPAVVRTELMEMLHGIPSTPAAAGAAVHRALLRAFVSTHLSQEHPLRSLSLFIDLLPRTDAGSGSAADPESSAIP